MAQPLQPSVIPIVFGKLDTKTAPRLAQQGTLTELVNGQMTQAGRIQKRPGYASLSKGTGVTVGQALTTFNGELVAQASNGVWGYSPLTGLWTRKGDWSYCQPSVDGVANTQSGHKNSDVAAGNGLACYVWEDLAGGVYYAVYDISTGQAVVPAALFGSNIGIRPHVVFLAGFFCVFYLEGNQVKVKQFAASAPTALSATVVFAGTISQLQHDEKAYAIAGKIAVAYNSSGNLAVAFYDPVSGVATAPTVSTVYGSISSAALSWLEDDGRDGNLFLGIHVSNGGLVSVATFDFSGAFLLNENITLTPPAGLPAQMTGHIDRTTVPITKHIIWHTNNIAGVAQDTYADFLSRGTFQTGTGATLVTSLVRSVGLASRSFVVSGVPHVVVTYDGKAASFATNATNIQQTYFVLNALTGVVVAKFLATLGGGMRDSFTLSAAPLLSGSTYVSSMTRKVQVASEGIAASPTTVILRAVSRVYMNFADPAHSTARSIAQNLFIPGGTVRRYDGASSPELGFNVYPEAPGLADGGAGSLATGTYQYVLVYTEFDKFGAIHRSGVSQVSSIGLNPSHRITVTFPYYRLTSKNNVIIEIYRRDVTTGTDTTNFYKVTSISTPILNSTTLDSGTFSDNLVTADKEIREILYTAGGVFFNDGPPPARVMTVHRDRVVLGGLDIANRLLPSKPALPDQGLAFSNNFLMATDPTDGETTALASMDDKLIDFHANAIYWYSGDGPTVTGQGGYSAPVRLPGNVGTTEPESMTVSDQGIMFRGSSAGGMYRLGRDLSLTYIGADVEAFNGVDVSAALVVPVMNQSRFFSTAGTTQVRDEYFQRWYTWTNQPAAGACIFQGLVTFIAPDGTVYQETPGVYSDAGEPIQMRLTLAPISPFTPGGWGRLWALQLIGDYHDAHVLRVRLTYDHTNFFWEEVAINAGAVIGGETYGASATFGSSTFGGVSPGDYRFEVKPRQQRFSAVGITIEEVIGDGSLSAGLDLSALVLQVGAQPGSLAKLPAARMMTTT